QESRLAPILLLATEDHFGAYTAQLLLAEGFNEFEIDSLNGARINDEYLQRIDAVILAQCAVTDAQKEMLGNYVRQGGNLIAFRPDTKLASVFGISETSGIINDGYISVNAGSGVGDGITRETLQFHGAADQCTLGSGTLIATLHTEAESKTTFPAIVRNEFGAGLAFAFLYNLPESIVLTRQGNWRHAGSEMDGITGIRAMDLFTHGWLDTTKNT